MPYRTSATKTNTSIFSSTSFLYDDVNIHEQFLAHTFLKRLQAKSKDLVIKYLRLLTYKGKAAKF